MAIRAAWLLLAVTALGCSDAAAPTPLSPLAEGQFSATISGAVSQTLAGRAMYLVYVSDGTLFIYLDDGEVPGLGLGGITMERRAGVPGSTGTLGVLRWDQASSGDSSRVAITAFVMRDAQALGVNMTTISGSVIIDSLPPGEIAGHFDVSGTGALASDTVQGPIRMSGRFRAAVFP